MQKYSFKVPYNQNEIILLTRLPLSKKIIENIIKIFTTLKLDLDETKRNSAIYKFNTAQLGTPVFLPKSFLYILSLLLYNNVLKEAFIDFDQDFNLYLDKFENFAVLNSKAIIKPERIYKEIFLSFLIDTLLEAKVHDFQLFWDNVIYSTFGEIKITLEKASGKLSLKKEFLALYTKSEDLKPSTKFGVKENKLENKSFGIAGNNIFVLKKLKNEICSLTYHNQIKDFCRANHIKYIYPKNFTLNYL